MSIKFQRSAVARKTPYTRQGTIQGIGPRARRALVIYILLAMMAAFLVSGAFLDKVYEFRGQPVFRAEATIVDKLIAEKSQGEVLYSFELGLTLAGVGEASAVVQVPQEDWERLSKGERIGVLYKRGRNSSRIQIVETGTLALPAPIQ